MANGERDSFVSRRTDCRSPIADCPFPIAYSPLPCWKHLEPRRARPRGFTFISSFPSISPRSRGGGAGHPVDLRHVDAHMPHHCRRGIARPAADQAVRSGHFARVRHDLCSSNSYVEPGFGLRDSTHWTGFFSARFRRGPDFFRVRCAGERTPNITSRHGSRAGIAQRSSTAPSEPRMRRL